MRSSAAWSSASSPPKGGPEVRDITAHSRHRDVTTARGYIQLPALWRQHAGAGSGSSPPKEPTLELALCGLLVEQNSNGASTTSRRTSAATRAAQHVVRTNPANPCTTLEAAPPGGHGMLCRGHA